jgi:hypothetical protein
VVRDFLTNRRARLYPSSLSHRSATRFGGRDAPSFDLGGFVVMIDTRPRRPFDFGFETHGLRSIEFRLKFGFELGLWLRLRMLDLRDLFQPSAEIPE